VAEEQARRLAVMVIAATEGAVALCRAERSRQPFDVVAEELEEMVVARS